jgi:hypothetical protein
MVAKSDLSGQVQQCRFLCGSAALPVLLCGALFILSYPLWPHGNSPSISLFPVARDRALFLPLARPRSDGRRAPCHGIAAPSLGVLLLVSTQGLGFLAGPLLSFPLHSTRAVKVKP